jgi:uncharacterized repeat protein (TIGR03803 family)
MKLRSLIVSATLVFLFGIFYNGGQQSAYAQVTFTTLHNFGVSAGDGSDPVSGLVLGSDGNFYGVTFGTTPTGFGEFYSLATDGIISELHNFGNGLVTNDGEYPVGKLVEGTDGNYYGTTEEGGADSLGTLFKITPTGTETILHSFHDGSVSNDGIQPIGGVVLGSNGIFYGVTNSGGTMNDGTVFSLTSAGLVTILHSFGDGTVGGDGVAPLAGLVVGGDGNLYGTTSQGGTAGVGTVFKITPTGTLTILHSFGDGTVTNDGSDPVAALVVGPNGDLFGTTKSGGVSGNYGVVYQIALTGGVTILHKFLDGTVTGDGSDPESQLTSASDGNLYGTTNLGGIGAGTVYKITPEGVLSIVYDFTSASSGSVNPTGGVIQGANGALYGTTGKGGPVSEGTVYELNLDLPISVGVLSTPTISPDGGTFAKAESVTISDSLVGAVIYYTTDGSTPTVKSTLYSGPITVSTSETLTAIATLIDYTNSPAATAVFLIGPTAPQPVITPDGGSFTTVQTATITDSATGATIYYTTNGTTPTTSSTTYTGTISINSSETIEATAAVSGDFNSKPAVGVFAINRPTYSNFSAGLQLISLPYSYPGVSLDTLFGYTGVTTAVWNSDVNSYALTPTSPANQISLGQGYWVRFPTPVSVYSEGTAASTNASFVINLEPGWNMIGDPFLQSVNISSCTFNAGSLTFAQASSSPNPVIGGSIYFYDTLRNSYGVATTLIPDFGDWIYAYTATDIDIPPPSAD